MNIYVQGRGSGKTRRMIEWLAEPVTDEMVRDVMERENIEYEPPRPLLDVPARLLLTHSIQEAARLEALGDDRSDPLHVRLDLALFWGWATIFPFHVHPRGQYEVMIDNLDLVLPNLFGNVVGFTATRENTRG